MRLLLPPSEAKLAGGDGPAKRPGETRLDQARTVVQRALINLLDQSDAAATLKLPAGTADDEVRANAVVATAATRPALERYRGIVYSGLGFDTLPPGARRRAEQSVLIFSGLFGVLRGDEPVPYYRVPVSATLPGIGPLTSFWRPVLAEVMPGLLDDELVVDLRSTDYAAMWRPAPQQPVVAVRVLSERRGREPAVLSYPSKLGKGRLARELLRSRAALRRPAQIVDAWHRAGGSGAVETPSGLDLLAPL